MQIFKRIDKWTFLVSKYHWEEEDRFTSKCVGFDEVDEYSFKGDVRKIWPEALKKYLELVFRELYMPERKSYYEAVKLQLNEMYAPITKRFKENILPKINYDRPLMKHQIESLKYMIQHKYNLLAYEQGLGKTVTSATISKVLDCKRTIIVSPAGVLWNWFHDMCDDWGYDPINWTMLNAKKSRCQFAFMEKFIVVNYENVKKYMPYLTLRNVDHIIVDECHKLKNSHSLRFLAVKALIDHFPDARVTLLTGTPATNRIDDMFAYYKLFNHLLAKNKSYFDRRYLRKSNGFKGKVTGAINLSELSTRHANMLIRKTAKECLDLPPLVINKYFMDETEMSKEYMDVLEQMYQNRVALQEAKENKSIKQLEGQVSGNVHTLNRILATSKASKVIELIDKLWEEGKKVIVFSGYSAPLEILEQHYGKKCVKIDGSVDTYKRSLLIEKYKTDDNCHVFLGNVKAAGVGINLVNTNHVIFMNFPFTPDDIEQPYKRAHRIGQNSTVNVYFTIVKNSIDEHIYNIIINKSRDINNLIDKNKKGVVNYESDVMNLVFNKLLDNYAKDHNLPIIKKQLTEV